MVREEYNTCSQDSNAASYYFISDCTISSQTTTRRRTVSSRTAQCTPALAAKRVNLQAKRVNLQAKR
eukprot:7072049-Pyramimonas_sp.AAC.1